MKITVKDDRLITDNILCFLDGELQSYACECDDEEGYIINYVIEDGKIIFKENLTEIETKKIYGKLQFSYINDATRDDEGNIVFGKMFDKIEDFIKHINERNNKE